MKIRPDGKGIFLGVLIIGAVAAPAIAHEGATGVVKERMDLMQVLGDRMKTIGAMAKGQTPLDSQTMAKAARDVADIAPTLPGKFPKGSLEKPSVALPAVWENWERFEQLSTDLGTTAGTLSEAASGGDQRAILQNFIAVGKVCSACHSDFRKKKDH